MQKETETWYIRGGRFHTTASLTHDGEKAAYMLGNQCGVHKRLRLLTAGPRQLVNLVNSFLGFQLDMNISPRSHTVVSLNPDISWELLREQLAHGWLAQQQVSPTCHPLVSGEPFTPRITGHCAWCHLGFWERFYSQQKRREGIFLDGLHSGAMPCIRKCPWVSEWLPGLVHF